MAGVSKFPQAQGSNEVKVLRRNNTEDIIDRLGVISPDRVILHNYPISHPISIFNASCLLEEGDGELRIFARIILGYYMYVSSIVELRIPIEDIETRSVNLNRYPGDIILYPTTKYDVWGTEDPRSYEIDGDVFITYTGRSINYFNPLVRVNRTLPVTAYFDEKARVWRKIYAFATSTELFGEVVSNKDAFLYKTSDGRLYLFHRPHLIDDTFHLMISVIDPKILESKEEIREVIIDNGVEVLTPSAFESKLGWAAPPIPVGPNRVVTLVHAVDKDALVYRVFALQLYLFPEEIIVEAVTPNYIMEPATSYEVIGDRPLTVFPCGNVVYKDKLVITYGAGDFMIGIGSIDMDTLMGELDKGRIY